ncbi:Hypothetical protein NTJ_07297 [Nesidiocoris tenuis]|uniref:Sushi domain-containing protein n=1 Tax=Nesidiocoris tenuis TaxID=355587 RepID=A0ABN7AR08_9HEMI|nr:Hypothetical protein NTJ_07297 [Nesidiocoris tenuis]
MGIGIPVCQANYFANGAGAVQPGCFNLDLGGTCSHLLVIEYFKESIDRDACTFKVEKCDGIPWAGEDNSCHPTNETVMGEYANTKLTGHFLFGTTRWPPYCPDQQSTTPAES